MQAITDQPPRLIKSAYLDKLEQQIAKMRNRLLNSFGEALAVKLQDVREEAKNDLFAAFGYIENQQHKELTLTYLIQDTNYNSDNYLSLMDQKVLAWFKENITKLTYNQ